MRLLLVTAAATATLASTASVVSAEFEGASFTNRLAPLSGGIATKTPLIVSCNTSAFASAYPDETLIFCDDFADLDLSVWSHEITLGGGGNWEFEYYTNNRTNSYADGGVLVLKPTLTADTIGDENVKGNNYMFDLWGSTPANLCTGNEFYGCSRTAGADGNIINPIQSAAIRSSDSFTFKYGRMEVSAKLPKGQWIWPAIWLLPRYESYGGWPASGEIDVMESRGNTNYPPGGVESFGSTLHFGPDWEADMWQLSHATYSLPDGQTLNDEFHVYGVYWGSTQLYTYIDSDTPENRVLSFQFNESLWQLGGWDKTSRNNPWRGSKNLNVPFDREFYMIFNVAVGGTNAYWPDGVDGKPWTMNDPHAANDFYAAMSTWYPTWGDPQGTQNAMVVDWVRIYQ